MIGEKNVNPDIFSLDISECTVGLYYECMDSIL